MADVITRTRTLDVTIEPLDGSGRKFVLYGLRNEKLEFKVNSPTRRAVSNTLVTQQRAVGRRQYTLEFAIFEPTIGNDGVPRRPDRSSVYDTTTGTTQVPTSEQLEKIFQLAKLSEEGTLLRYSGITASVDRCAILSFNSDTVYTTGTGSLVIEERPEKLISLQDIAIGADAFEAALKTALGTNDLSDTGIGLDKLADGTISPERYTTAIQQFIKQAFGKDTAWNVYVPKNDQATLNAYGLGSLPVTFQDHRLFHDDIVLFPSDGSDKKPKIVIIPIDPKAAVTTRTPGGGFETTTNIIASIAGLFVRFEFYSVNGFGTSCRIEVYDSRVPPVTDSRSPSYAQVTPNQPAPNPYGQSSKDQFTGATINATPIYTVNLPDISMTETHIADAITVAILPRYYVNPSLVDAIRPTDPREPYSAVVIADYR